MNGSEHIVSKINKDRIERLATIKYAFDKGISKYGSDIEWDIRTNFPEGFNWFTNEEIAYIKKELGYELEYHLGIFRAHKINTRDTK